MKATKMQGRKVDLGWSRNGRVDSSMESYENIISAEESRQQEEEAVSILPRPRASKNEEKGLRGEETKTIQTKRCKE